MANIKSAKKRIELTKNKTLINKAKKTEIKTYIKKFETALNEGNLDEAQVLIKAIDKKLKRAAQRNIIHDNAVARKMSHLTKRLNKAM
ncbi:MAG: 30S ribosomal protein S20 [Tissierellaceae bacterium]|nr:30S ribosomal protein S20 [Tissierellaceae bacterium]